MAWNHELLLLALVTIQSEIGCMNAVFGLWYMHAMNANSSTILNMYIILCIVPRMNY